MQIDGRKINKEIGEKLKQEIETRNIKPSLGILCIGEDAVSMSYKNGKEKFGEKYGFTVKTLRFNEDISKEFIIEQINILQQECNGVIVQLPLPEKFKEATDEILSYLKKEKDVDDLNSGNFIAPIVLALNKIMEFVETQTNGEFNFHQKNFCIVGLGQVVGMPIKDFLENNNYKVIVIGRDDHERIKNCEVVISGVGIPKLIKSDFIKEGSVLIDYGCSYVDGKPFGDFDEACFLKAKFYTPVPGCMGPLVVASLFENVLKSYEEKS